MKHEKLSAILKNIQSISRLVAGDYPPAIILDALSALTHEVQNLGHQSPIKILKKVVSDFMRPNYFQWNTFWTTLNILLAQHEMGMIHPPTCSNADQKTFTLENLDETLLTYLHVTWYRMESGQFEFVAYITE